MEKIKKALEKAQKIRMRTPVASRIQRDLAEYPQQVDAKIDYLHTRVINPQDKELREKCVIADIDNDATSDAYKVLRTHVVQRMRANNWNSLSVTSPTSGNGKTLTSINLAISLAREVNQTVLLVDLDFRYPNIQDYFSLDKRLGISDYINSNIQIEKILFNPGVNRLVILPGNECVKNSSEILSSPKMVELVKELVSYYSNRIVIFDMPPILTCDDVLAFSPFVDSILLVIEEAKTSKSDLKRAIHLLDESKLLGTVLNKSKLKYSTSYS